MINYLISIEMINFEIFRNSICEASDQYMQVPFLNNRMNDWVPVDDWEEDPEHIDLCETCCKNTSAREFNCYIKHKTNQVIQECMFRNQLISVILMKSF